MEARAYQSNIGVPATKVRQVIDLIRNKPVEEALNILRFSTKPISKIIENVLRSAIANALSKDEENPVDADELFVVKVYADQARSLKRLRPRARGSADRIVKGHSHLTMIVGNQLG